MSMSQPRLLAAMAAHLPRLPVLLFVFLALHVPASHGDPLPTTYDGSMCLESSFWCGSVEIRYPFYLANATKATDDYSGYNYSCGYTDLEISCLGEGPSASPVIRLGGENYTVQDISYDSDNYKVTLVDRDVLVGGSCPAVRHGVTFDGMWLHNTSSNDDLTFYFGCYSGEPRMPAGLHKYQIDCNFESPVPGGGVAFVLTPDDHDKAQEHDLAADCHKVVSVLVKNEVLEVARTWTNFTSGAYGYVLKQGFELGWSPMETGPCPQCEESGGKCAYRQNKTFLGCLCSDGKVGKPDCNSTAPASRHGNKKTTIGIVASTSCLLFLSLLILAFFLTCKYGSLPFKSKNKPRIESFLQKNGNLHPKRYNYADVKSMTKSFAVKLGQGGFGAVYKGNLSDGGQVAVKMLKDVKGDGEEFMNEVASISRTSHVNVVTLLGFCLQGSKRALIYEYMPNGSLERYTFGTNINSENILSWEKLFEIAIGIARGLEYLHRGCNTRIVHFDIKPHNILLDQDFCPKISDFGLAKLCLNKESAISIVGARGTIGYIAPEVYSKRFGTVSSKSDVYSYGMMVLELVGARDKNINADSESSSQYFPQWIYEHVDEYCISASEINGETTELVRKMIVVGLWCIQVIPTDRPTMTRVMEMLEGSTSNLELPPKVLLG
ncbi:LEAF RUST 10 DISEASE-RESISTANCEUS RECEPTOR-LIKE PROTEIN KINASE-like 2.1 isoform X3 [Setaria viridis]|uniref:LEAF RUST 10 DISEASE-RESISTANCEUS RECEPTOR-LIKE PROTEIN KINASE-like 2.1 isoform X3 n=1 Tax=Setaria viridis TaxID=4556 RepID=UPI003B3BB617